MLARARLTEIRRSVNAAEWKLLSRRGGRLLVTKWPPVRVSLLAPSGPESRAFGRAYAPQLRRRNEGEFYQERGGLACLHSGLCNR